MNLHTSSCNPGVVSALLTALLFGASAPIAKWTLPLIVAGALMALGIWLHVTETLEHPHASDS